MLFNSLAFAVFMPIVFLLYWALPHKYRFVLLLLVNYYFYMSFNPNLALLLFFVTALTYICGLQLSKAKNLTVKRAYLAVGITIAASLLLFYKYASFFTQAVLSLLKNFSFPISEITLQILLPVGISFYTFKVISYLVDIYRGKIDAEAHFGYYASYVSFFPTIVSGPIDRAADTLVLLKTDKKFQYQTAVYSLRLMLLGFIKKFLIADALTKYVDIVFDNVYQYTGLTLLAAALLFTFQIYCDFSGYSDIAIGCAGLLGINCRANFVSPYFASSIKDFWSRWHISLSSWFRDYIYIPLGGNRVSSLRKAFNVMITFLLSGLWHGANWTFLFWGAIHGFYQVIENFLHDFIKFPKLPRFLKPLQILLTFFLVSIAWIFFRAETLSEAIYIVTNMWNNFSVPMMLEDLSMSAFSLVKIVPFILALMIYDYISLKKNILMEMSSWKWPVRWIIYLGITLVIVVLKIHNGTSQAFIYFQF